MKYIVFKVLFLLSFSLIQDIKAYDSMMEFENSTTSKDGLDYLKTLNHCFKDQKRKALFPYELVDFNNNCIPTVLGKGSGSECTDSNMGTYAMASSLARGYMYFKLLQAFPVGSVLALLGLGVEYLIMVDVCSNDYIVAPHEFINEKLNRVDCQERDGEIKNVAAGAIGVSQAPFFYTCNPKYDVKKGDNLPDNDPNIGFVYGYMGSASQYCSADNPHVEQATKNVIGQEMIGKAVVHHRSIWKRFWDGHSRCNRGGTTPAYQMQISPGDTWYNPGGYHYYAYYRFNSDGHVQLCVATPWTLLPIMVGCTYVAPPSDVSTLNDFLLGYIRGNRCLYLKSGREDLQSLGAALPQQDHKGHNGEGVKKFLESDLHFTSTVVGCLQDLLTKTFIEPTNNGRDSFFATVQTKLRDIVMAVLTLYVAMVGIKIMSSPNPPPRGEFIMYILKFALVAYFALGNVWSSTNGGHKDGLYHSLINVSPQIASFFMSAQNYNDPVGLCKYHHNGDELLKERPITASFVGNTVKPTEGGQGNVIMTVWDLIDCKLANYLNLGSCKYSLSGLFVIWFIPVALFSGANGFLLMVLCFIYLLMLLLIVFKFVHTFILSLFVITILVLVAPLMLCFALFEYTKSIFQSWMKNLLGYMLYPGLMFAFIALMLATFDSIFYGNIDLRNGDTVREACEKGKVDSLYCTTLKEALAGGADISELDPCKAGLDQMTSRLTDDWKWWFIEIPVFSGDSADKYWSAIGKMSLFAALFYLFMGSVSEFLSAMVGVSDIGGHARGSVNALSGLWNVQKVGMQDVKTAAGFAYNATGLRALKDKISPPKKK